MDRLPPDTTKAVQNAIAYGDSEWSPTVGIDEDAPKLAQLAIAADRKALEEQGYTVAPLDDVAKARAFDAIYQNGALDDERKGALRWLLARHRQSLGLPIEVTE